MTCLDLYGQEEGGTVSWVGIWLEKDSIEWF